MKGEKSLLYGLIWHIIRDEGPQQNHHQQALEVDERALKGQEEERIGWVRSIEKHSPEIAALKIRSE